MSRSERNQTQVNPFLKIKIMFLIMLFVGLMVITNIYLNGIIRVETPEVDLGRKVVIHLEDGKEVQTYENLLVNKKGKLYYQGEFNTIDVTGGIVVFQDWD
ncbi:MAG: hypothetical protein K0S25_1301 [Bacillus sp. (in: firmicutes)]|nr:hypothetical protein [Bacillus sp. (in: firmicutes)]